MFKFNFKHILLYICLHTEENASKSATTYEEMTSLTTQRETVTNQEGAILFLTSTDETSSSMYEGTTQVSPTIDQNYTRSLVAIVGHSISLPCSSSDTIRFFWGHRSVGSNVLSIIYNGFRVIQNDQLASQMTVSNCYDRKCTFHVNELRLGAAGTFTCMRSDSFKYWSLTVLGK